MVGIVVVSHSRPLARAAAALATEMLHARQVRIAIAAGLDEATFGTDAVAIQRAITAADQGDGVVVLMDIGSAVLSAELALDLLDDVVRERVVLCPAPLVEGLVVAAVAAAGGANRMEVAAEAAGALAGKQSHLGAGAPTGGPPRVPRPGTDLAPADSAPELAGTFVVTNRHGLHARPASRMVQQVRALDARVRLRNLTTGSGWVPASSLSRVATLGALGGHEVEVRASGSQAREALDHLIALAARAFDEDEVTAGGAGAGVGGHAGGPAGGGDQRPARIHDPLAPVAASPGIGIGPAWSLRPVHIVPEDGATEDPAGEWRRLREALAAARREVQRLRAGTAREMGEAEAAIFDAHLLLLDDADLLDDVRARVDSGQAAASAWAAAITGVGEQFAAIPDPYLQARAADVRALGDQVLRELLGVSREIGRSVGVLVAADLTPAEAAELDPERVAGIALAFGSATAHSAILARARGIPAVVGLGPAVLELAEGTVLIVDGTRGEVLVDPPAATLRDYRTEAEDLARRDRRVRAHAAQPARTRDGVHILVGANVGSVEDAYAAAGSGADLAGLVRTEFLFLRRDQAPDVDEQETVYREIATALGGRRVTLRTLDVGGDKPLGYLPMPAETNPFLGVRGIRLSLARPQLLADQLLAMVRVAHDVPVSLMFPMISTIEEFRLARQALDDAIKLAGRGEPDGLQVGIMVEVPAAALKAAAFARHVDFLSIGTNDLTQYALASERGNAAVAGLGDPFDPGVLRLIEATCRGAGERATVAVCGEFAADERATALLVGLGVRELSVVPRAVPHVKAAVRDLDVAAAARLAASTLDAAGASEVRDLVRDGRATMVGRR